MNNLLIYFLLVVEGIIYKVSNFDYGKLMPEAPAGETKKYRLNALLNNVYISSRRSYFATIADTDLINANKFLYKSALDHNIDHDVRNCN